MCSTATANTDRLPTETINEGSVTSELTSKASSSMKSGFWESLLNGVLSTLQDVAINQSIKADVVEACRFLDTHDTYRALQVISNTQKRLRKLNDNSYRRLSEQLGAICSDIRSGNVVNARNRLRYLERNLNVQSHSNNNGHNSGHNNGYQNGISYGDVSFYRSIGNNLRTSLNYLRTNNPRIALSSIRQVEAALAQRNTNLDRQLRQTAIRIQDDIRQNRLAYAMSKIQTMQSQVQDAITSASNGSYNTNPGHNLNPGHGHQGLSLQETKNRREWIRDINDLIDTIQDNNIQMARRDIRRLISDIKTDGNSSSFNRELLQQLQFSAVSLNQGFPDTRAIIGSLRQISRKIETSLR
jgi:hypothetical protein